ncbi:MAG TPA: RDD family protein [Thermoanaerobacter sp.]|nr:RDD family protein [Thermoanaerobacter sp.]
MERCEFASFWLRFSAFLIDSFILAIPITIIKSLIPLYAVYVNFFITAIYFIVFVALFGKTPGKMFFKIKVVKKDMSNVSWKEGILRFLGIILSQALLFSGYILMLWDKNRQTLHDKIARTYVIIDK